MRQRRHSVLFLRLFSVVVLMILTTALFATAIFHYISRSVYTQIKEEELRTRAAAMARMVGNFRGRSADLSRVLELFTQGQSEYSLLGAQVLLVDSEGEILFISEALNADLRPALIEVAQSVLQSGEELDTDQIPLLRRASMVGVAVPVSMGFRSRGALLLVVPLIEALVAMSGLNSALLLSLMLSIPLTFALVYYAIGRVVHPLRQMTFVANKMARGDFSRRADDEQKGEVGELGVALNFLSHQLSQTIATLILERNRLKHILDGLSEGIVAIDRLGNVTHTNPALRDLFAQGTVGTLGPPDVTALLDDSIWVDFGAVVNNGEAVTRPLSVRDRVILMRIAPVYDDANGIAGAVALFSDITESERLERTRRDYVANVSHEMRTPLTAMRALLEPLSEGMVPSEDTKERYYAIMLRETMRLSRLINDLLELSRLQSGALALSTQPMRLDDVCDELRDKYDPIAEESGLRFEIDPALRQCPAVLSNQDRVEQVLVILIDNAIKYTPEGGEITLSASWDGDKATLCVRDNGIGVAPEDQPYLFDRFYKVDRAHSGLGSGLGLSIARELLLLMGEGIWLESEPGKGSAFYFTLKRAQ